MAKKKAQAADETAPKKAAAKKAATKQTGTKQTGTKKVDANAYAELAKLDDKALVHTELQFERDLIEASFRHSTGQLDDVSKLMKLRHSIARARTAERSREREQGLGHNALRDRHRSSFKPELPKEQGARLGAGFMKGIAERLGKGETAPEKE
jgi:ribosomal protein L29